MQITNVFKNFGPGLIMASSAIGGSHIIVSTQAGVKYGYQLAWFIIAVNLLKYPFYRFAFRYTLENDKNVLEGYVEKGKGYLWLFLLFNAIATVVNIAGGALLSAALLAPLLPFNVSFTILSIIVLLSFLLILSKKQYRILDTLSKNIMLILSVVTVFAFVMAVQSLSHSTAPETVHPLPSPWTLTSIPFLIALMGWMPAPMELSAAASLWVVEKKKLDNGYVPNGLLDFNVGYSVTIALALIFMGLGALVQYQQGVAVASGGKFVAQFVDMYAIAIGEWTRWFVGLLALMCIYGTTLAALDGYSRTNMAAVHLLCTCPKNTSHALFFWMSGAATISLVVILFFQSSVKHMIPFAMTMSFISAPIFAWLNFSLYRHSLQKSSSMFLWAWLGLFYLVAMLGVYIAHIAGLFS